MWVLGFNGGSKRAEDEDHFGLSAHDASAVLFHDDELVAAIEEERLNRIKHTNCFPANAIQRCLELGGINLADVDWVATNTEERYVKLWAASAILQDPATPTPHEARDEIAIPFERSFGVDVRSKIRFCHHHEAHLWSAYLLSGYDECLSVSIDGQGDNYSWLVGLCRGGSLRPQRSFSVGHSLGNLYSNVIQLIGYRRFDEYKAMGLAPYGDPEVFRSLFNRCYSLLPEGEYALRPDREWLAEFAGHGLLDLARRKGCAIEKVHQDIAAALQELLERVVMHVLTHERSKSGQRKLALAGGVAHNCSLNGVIANSGLFDSVFVQPAGHDAGGALGAAYSVLADRRSGYRSSPMANVYLGAGLPAPSQTLASIESWRQLVSVRHEPDITTEAARLLASGAVIGWVQGRAEFGPRALGNRSILADARPAQNKDVINAMVKKREHFRPFAPSIVDTHAAKYFELPKSECDLSFMTFVVKVREEYRSVLQAITHVDGTARIQTVSRTANPRYWELLSAFGGLTGIPVLLNTSFNNNAEPIVDSVDDAIACFLTTGLDYLVVDEFIVEKTRGADLALLGLAVEVPPHRRLVRRKVFREREYVTAYEIESAKSEFFGPKSTDISQDMYRVLAMSDGKKAMRDLIQDAGLQLEAVAPLEREFATLWSERWVRAVPAIQAVAI